MVPEHITILKAFTHFVELFLKRSYLLLDHSPGNYSVKNINGDYHFYLVDLNRMRFETIFRFIIIFISNFSRFY